MDGWASEEVKSEISVGTGALVDTGRHHVILEAPVVQWVLLVVHNG